MLIQDPVDMEDILYDRSGQYITDDNYDTSFLGFIYNQKVYNGPGYLRYRSGERENREPLKTGINLELGQAMIKRVIKKFIGEYEQGKAHGKWTGFHPNGNKKYEGVYEVWFSNRKVVLF